MPTFHSPSTITNKHTNKRDGLGQKKSSTCFACPSLALGPLNVEQEQRNLSVRTYNDFVENNTLTSSFIMEIKPSNRLDTPICCLLHSSSLSTFRGKPIKIKNFYCKCGLWDAGRVWMTWNAEGRDLRPPDRPLSLPCGYETCKGATWVLGPNCLPWVRTGPLASRDLSLSFSWTSWNGQLSSF